MPLLNGLWFDVTDQHYSIPHRQDFNHFQYTEHLSQYYRATNEPGDAEVLSWGSWLNALGANQIRSDLNLRMAFQGDEMNGDVITGRGTVVGDGMYECVIDVVIPDKISYYKASRLGYPLFGTWAFLYGDVSGEKQYLNSFSNYGRVKQRYATGLRYNLLPGVFATVRKFGYPYAPYLAQEEFGAGYSGIPIAGAEQWFGNS